jgi:hypothetical protein
VLSFLPTRIRLAAALPCAFAPSPLSRLPLDRDTLGSVLSFLTLRELAAALSVSKEWSAAAQTMRPAMFTADITCGDLDALLSSPNLLRHVGQLGRAEKYLLSLRPDNLSLFTEYRAPHLRSLSARLVISDGDESMRFPPRLQQLHLFANNWPADANEAATALLTAIGQLQQLHSLQLEIPSEAVSLSLAPLKQLPLLRDLELDMPFPLHVEQFAAELRALHWLHRLYIHLPGEQSHRVSLCNA